MFWWSYKARSRISSSKHRGISARLGIIYLHQVGKVVIFGVVAIVRSERSRLYALMVFGEMDVKGFPA